MAGTMPLGAEDAWDTTVLRELFMGKQLGEYVITQRLGRGGMGVVFEGLHPQLGKRVAIKLLRPDRDAAGLSHFGLLDEAKAVIAIRHRHIIDVFGFGEVPGLGQYIVMDLLDGQPLDVEIRQHAPMSAEQVISIIDDTLAALIAAHAVNVVHRDLKPQNLFLVTESGGTRYVKVLDFGLAKILDAPHSSKDRLSSRRMIGTPEYMSPEQASSRPLDGRSDLYSLGVIAFEMLTARLPFTADNPLAIALMQVKELPPRPRDLVPSIPPQLEAYVLRLLEKSPDLRPRSAEAARAELAAVKTGTFVAPAPPRRPLSRPVLITGVVALTLAAGTVTLAVTRAPHEPIPLAPLPPEPQARPALLPPPPPQPEPPAPAPPKPVEAPPASARPPRTVASDAKALRKRLARVEAAWHKRRATVPDGDARLFDAMLAEIRPLAAKEDAASRKQATSALDAFVKTALRNVEP